MDLSKMKPLPPLTGVAGLGNIFKDAAKAIEEMKGAGSSLSTEVQALATDIETVRQHVRREHEDFHFKVSTLGNGGGTASETQQEPLVTLPSTSEAEQPEAPQASASPPEVGQVPTFQPA
jgi:hypothetical protein